MQRRIGFLTGAAVAVAVAVTGLAGYLSAQESLYDQLDQELIQAGALCADIIGADVQSFARTGTPHRPTLLQHLLRSDGYVITPDQQAGSLVLGDEELALAKLQSGASARNGVDSHGETYRIVAVPLPQADVHYAVVVGQSLTPTLKILSNLRIVLFLVGSTGIALGGALGILVARAAMRPVRDLTLAVAEVTQSDSLEPIPVEGNDELSHLTRSFNTMLYSLASSRARQNRLIADASHELRTPLTSLRTNIELLAADENAGMLPPHARQEILGDLGAQLVEFSSLIGDLVHLTRDPGKVVFEPLNLRDVVTSALERVRRRGHGIEFATCLSSHFVYGEADQLERAITNLLDNAVKFSPSGGTVRVVMDGEELRISDEGPGITEEDLPHVFDRFYRSEKARNTPGTGLGLSIVAQTVARHHGWVRASRAKEGGAEFTVHLPSAFVPPES
ncbi:MAG: HAMP domain-containing sensor histidine kinase [Propionibacteriaceae bacterium]|nr:HAMP domain-containing sensor histidine kinase [Propionibacteriaceae bacterium]